MSCLFPVRFEAEAANVQQRMQKNGKGPRSQGHKLTHPPPPRMPASSRRDLPLFHLTRTLSPLALLRLLRPLPLLLLIIYKALQRGGGLWWWW